MNEPIAEILAKCLERMEAGASVESCLADFPGQAAELKPLLQLTQQMNHLSKVGPRPAFARNARLQLENQLMTSGTAVTFKQLNRHTRQEHNLLQRRFSMSMLQLILATVLALTATTAGTAYAANASSPGDFLHGLDLAMENVQVNLAPDVWSKVQLRLEFASERLTEAQATFSANDPADGLEAMNEYGTEISAIAQTIGSADGADQEALALLVETAQGVHKDVLTNLLDKVPEQAQESIQKALNASHASENIPGLAPADAGAPDNAGAPEGVGAPDNGGAPDGVGVPGAAPGVDISTCTRSLSKETAHALVDLAKEHGVDHQYVLENFCALGTLAQVSEMLSELNVPPSGVPAGPPTDVPAGPPADTPGGRPSGTPGGPPINPPGKP
jgi:Domain of unknown function (DUF5667)